MVVTECVRAGKQGSRNQTSDAGIFTPQASHSELEDTMVHSGRAPMVLH
jgi:hypothetical protein